MSTMTAKKTTKKAVKEPATEPESTEQRSTELLTEKPLSTERLRRFHRVMELLLREIPDLPEQRSGDENDVTLSYTLSVRIGEDTFEFDNLIRLPGLLSEENRVDATEMLDHQLDLITRPVKNLVMKHIQSEDAIMPPLLA